MRSRSLVGRVAMVQVITAVSMLAFVVAATLVGVTTLLVKQWDHDLQAAAMVVADELREAQGRGEVRVWLDRELDEHRPPGVRLEVRDRDGSVLAAAGEGLAFGIADAGCANRGTFRTCAIRMDRLTITAGRSRQPGIEAQRRFAGALGLATAVAALMVLAVARRVTRKALAPLSAFADRAASIEPGTGMRIGVANGLDELERLGGRFDGLIERFEEALSRERRFRGRGTPRPSPRSRGRRASPHCRRSAPRARGGPPLVLARSGPPR